MTTHSSKPLFVGPCLSSSFQQGLSLWSSKNLTVLMGKAVPILHKPQTTGKVTDHCSPSRGNSFLWTLFLLWPPPLFFSLQCWESDPEPHISMPVPYCPSPLSTSEALTLRNRVLWTRTLLSVSGRGHFFCLDVCSGGPLFHSADWSSLVLGFAHIPQVPSHTL